VCFSFLSSFLLSPPDWPTASYVALSRARRLEGLRVVSWTSKALGPHPIVERFYRQNFATDGLVLRRAADL
jgi:hypothetical protein